DVKAEMVPVRAGSIHLNILKLLEYGPCYNCFSIVGAYMVEPGVLNVDIQITHPFANLDFSIFDVRGIIIFEGEHDFNELDRYISDPALGDGELVNAEGFTSLYNCLTYGWAGELVTYCPGILSTPSMPEADCNGFLRHNTNNPANTRNAFYAGDSVTRTYTLRMPTTEFKLGYAVDANWAVPISSPVTDPITDFGVNANCQEPWKIEVSCPPIDAGGYTDLTIDVYDYEGAMTLWPPELECPELFNGVLEAAWLSEGGGYSHWIATINNYNGAGAGTYKCLLKVEAVENDPDGAPWLDVSAYQVFDVEVSGGGPTGDGWARTWGGASIDRGAGVAIDSAGNIYVAGYFDYYIEFDFPEGDDIYFLDPEEPDQSYLVKFSPSGAYEWSRAWGGSSDSDRAYAVAADGIGHIFVTGRYEGSSDFDPGPGVDMRTCENSWTDVYVSMFDTSGNYYWVRTWGGTGDDEGLGVAADVFGNVFVAGIFEGSADFDPGGGYDGHSSFGDDDA
ncbi:SBBP repeat-containing protein, partial [bacterium]|nr:SBBP repeat-containing protein [bacterium]